MTHDEIMRGYAFGSEMLALVADRAKQSGLSDSAGKFALQRAGIELVFASQPDHLREMGRMMRVTIDLGGDGGPRRGRPRKR